jgi:predicted nucleic acid-binding protein
MNKVVLDANVLYSNILRGLFLWLSWGSLFQITWSDEIWDEVFRNYSKDDEKKQKFRQNIEGVVFKQFNSSRKTLDGGYTLVGLPDKNDEHVVALARQQNCSTIVTSNLKDFPDTLLNPVGISVCSPDLFLCDLFLSEPDEVKDGVLQHMKAQTKIKLTKAIYLEKLKNAKATKFVSILETEDAAGNLFPEVWP